MNKEEKQQLKQEFGIHFKNSPDEFLFLQSFIDDLLKAQRTDLKKEIRKMKDEVPLLDTQIKKIIKLLK